MHQMLRSASLHYKVWPTGKRWPNQVTGIESYVAIDGPDSRCHHRIPGSEFAGPDSPTLGAIQRNIGPGRACEC